MVTLENLLPYTTGAVRTGVSTERLFDSAMIYPNLTKPGSPISSYHILLFYLSLMEGCDDESWGFAKKKIPFGLSAIVIRAVLGSANFEQALKSFQYIYNTMTPVLITVEFRYERVLVGVRCNFADESEARKYEDGFLGWMWSIFSRYLDCPLPLSSISTRDPHHPRVGELHWATGDKLRLAATATIGFARSWLATPSRVVPTRDSAFQCFARSIQPALPNTSRPNFDKRSLLSLSEEAGVSTSTMSRRLSVDGNGFRAERKIALVDRGLEMLRETCLSVDAIAAELGYSDARSLRRLLKSSLGVTPRDVREGGWIKPGPTGEQSYLMTRLRQLSSRFDL